MPSARPKKMESTRRKKGEGTKIMRHKASGRLSAQVDLGMGLDGKRIRVTVYGDTESEVIAKRDELLVAHRRGTLAAPEKTKLKELLEGWLERQAPLLSPRSRELYAYTIRLYVPAHLQAMRLQAIKRHHIKKLEADLTQRGLSVSTRSKVLQHLRAAFEDAIEDEILTLNPARGIRVRATNNEKNSKVRRDEKALTEDERDRFLEAARPDPMYALFYTMFSLGTRRGEALGLRWQDLHFKTKTADLVQAVKIVGGKAVIGPLKTVESRRDVPMSDDLTAVLEVRREAQRRDKDILESAWVENGLVFTTSLGTPIHPRNVNRTIERLSEKANIEHLELPNLDGSIKIERHPEQGFVLRTSALAKGLGVSTNTIRVMRRERPEVLEGSHWIPGKQANAGNPIHLWTLEGAFLLASLLNSEQARIFHKRLEVFSKVADPKATMRHFASHAGRYTFISLQRRGGVALEVIAAQTGHTRLSTLVDHYRSIYPEEKREAVYSIAKSQQRHRHADSEGQKRIGRKIGSKPRKKRGHTLKKVRP
jgi:integrase